MSITAAQVKALKSITPEGFMDSSAATLQALRARDLIRLETVRLDGTGPQFSAVRITPAGENALAQSEK